MKIFKDKEPKVDQDPTQPLEDDIVVEEVDRSEYNCGACKGEGLVEDGGTDKRCTSCGGTGKVN